MSSERPDSGKRPGKKNYHLIFQGDCATFQPMITIGGWRIVKTMGQRITKIRPVGGFCAEISGSIALFIATALGIPVSTTHTITGSIVGVGTAQSVSAVRWGVAGDLLWAWILTIP